MLTTSSTELRSARPSLFIRFVKWLISKRKPVFPHTAEGFATHMAQRKRPEDAPMPVAFRTRFPGAEWEAEGQKVITLHPKDGPGNWHMLYFHGGGFVEPMFKVHWPLVAAMIDTCGVSVTLPLYDVVPESSHEAQDRLADAVYATLAETIGAERIILNGDSAGGHMALSLALRLARAGKPMPAKLALFAPWLDLTLADPAIAAVEPHDVMLKIGTLRACGKLFAGERDPGSAEVSPLYTPIEELKLLPPTRIWTGRHDLFIVDSRTFAQRLIEAGIDAKLYEYEAAPHVFMALPNSREAKDVFALLREFIDNQA